MQLLICLMLSFFLMLIHFFFITGIENKVLKNYVLEKKQILIKAINHKKDIIYYKREKVIFNRSRNGKRKLEKIRFSCQIAYLVFDIIKIFGRLSNKELLGHVISHNNEFIDSEKTPNRKKKNWEILFDNDSSSITFENFQFFLKNTKFEWPLTVNSGQIKNQGAIDIPVAPIVYVENCRKVTEEYKAKNKNSKFNIKTINKIIEKLPIANDAIQCVFSSFSNLEILTKTQFINKIHEWAPSDGIVDWYTFVYNLKEEPSDNIKRFLD